MMIWTLIHLADLLLWLFLAGSVAYVVLFAIASLFRRKRRRVIPQPSSQSRFLVLIPAYHEDKVILNTVETFLRQDYPPSKMQTVVISDHMSPATNARLSALPITLLQPAFEKSSKAKALQYAMKEVRGERLDVRGERPETGEEGFDFVVILDADNVVAPDFLSRLNAVCQQGWQAIQCHRTAKNSDNDIAALDGLSEEINNTLFRRAHNNIGLSSALIGSGMCFSYEWFRRNVGQLSSAVEDRELEALLARQRIYVRYEEDLHVMDEKVSSQDNFQRQRLRWMTGQVQTLLLMLPYLHKAVMSLNLDYIDKTLQQMLIPRSILLVALPCLSVLMTLLAPVWSIKWWCLTAAFCLALLIAIPSRLRSQALSGKIVMLIKLVWRMVKNLVHIDRKDQEFIHTTHDK